MVRQIQIRVGVCPNGLEAVAETARNLSRSIERTYGSATVVRRIQTQFGVCPNGLEAVAETDPDFIRSIKQPYG